MSVVICHPHTAASHEIGKEALAQCYNLILYMPNQMDKMWGEDIGLDLAILAARGGINSVKKQLNQISPHQISRLSSSPA